MLVALYQLRRDGARIADRSWQNSPLIGSITFCTVETTRQLTFQPDGSSLPGRGLTLYEPQLTHLGGRRMRFLGFEGQGGPSGRSVVQEWLCELYERDVPPPAYPDRGSKSPGDD